MKARWWAEGAGAALLVMFPFFFQLLLPGNILLYHHELPVRNLILGIMVDLAVLAVMFAGCLALVQRLPARPRLVAGALLAAGVLCRAWQVAFTLLWATAASPDSYGNQRSARLVHAFETGMNLTHEVAAGLVLLCLLFVFARPPWIRVIVQITRLGLAAFAFSILWILPQLVYLATLRGATRHSSTEARHSLIAANPAPQGRLVWILFDELSYRLVFDQRPPGQEFPNFERLHDESFSFDRVDPAGFYTDHIVPSLLEGKEMEDIRSTAAGELEYLGPRRRSWHTLDAGSSLFGLADEKGWNPGVAGWFNPYCRVFASVLTQCWWTGAEPFQIEELGASENKSILGNAIIVPKHYLRPLLGTAVIHSDVATQHIDDYRYLMDRARALIQDSRIHFVFLHLPTPHPPGIYDRRSHQLRDGGDYLDNLTLADDTLGELMEEIGATADGARTTVIVSSDHSWRVPLWDASADWRPEEERITHDAFDRRPVFLIHFPGQTDHFDISDAVPELDEHNIIAGILNRQIENEAQMAASLHSGSSAAAGRQLARLRAGW